MSKKTTVNRYRPDETEKKAKETFRIRQIFRAAAFFGFIAVMSIGAIFAHDLVTQSPFFLVTQVKISGLHRVSNREVLDLARLKKGENIFSINTLKMENRLKTHPWIADARVKRSLCATLIIHVDEEVPLAVVNIENMARIIINDQGRPFKEYNPETDQVEGLPVISGVDLTLSGEDYLFKGRLFNAVMDFLHIGMAGWQEPFVTLTADKNTGIDVHARDIYNATGDNPDALIRIKLGFDHFPEKLDRAKQISTYISKNFPDKTICSMDLFDIEKVFIKTKLKDASFDSLEKGA